MVVVCTELGDSSRTPAEESRAAMSEYGAGEEQMKEEVPALDPDPEEEDANEDEGTAGGNPFAEGGRGRRREA